MDANRGADRGLRVFEMSCLRRIAEVARLDRVKNEDIRNSLKIRRDIEKVELRRIYYFGHVARMDQNRLPNISMHGRVNGTRTRGRPRKRWIDTIKNCEERGMTVVEAQLVALERHTWRTELKTSERATASPRR